MSATAVPERGERLFRPILCTNSAVSHNANERQNSFTQIDKSYVCQTTFLQLSSTGVSLSVLLFTSALPSKSPRYCVISNNLHIIFSSPTKNSGGRLSYLSTTSSHSTSLQTVYQKSLSAISTVARMRVAPTVYTSQVRKTVPSA